MIVGSFRSSVRKFHDVRLRVRSGSRAVTVELDGSPSNVSDLFETLPGNPGEQRARGELIDDFTARTAHGRDGTA